MSKVAKWVKFHPGSSCSVGDTEIMSQERFDELFESEHVVEVVKAKDEKKESAVKDEKVK